MAHGTPDWIREVVLYSPMKLTDINQFPSSYIGAEGKFIRVNEVPDEVEFTRNIGSAAYPVDDIITKGPWVDVRAFGAKVDGSTDDDVAIAAAYASITTGIIRFPKGNCYTTGTLTGKKGVILVGEGPGLTTITFGGLGTFWIDVDTPASEGLYDDMGIVGMKINVLTGALGAIRHGRLAAAFDEENFSDRWRLKDLWITGAGDAGSFGLCLTQLAQLHYRNIWVDNFERNIANDRGTANVYVNIRTISGVTNAVGIEWIGVAGSGMQEYVYGLDVLIGGTNSEAVKIGGQNVNIFSLFMEKYGTTVATALLHLTANATVISLYKPHFADSSTGAGSVTDHILTDNVATVGQRGVIVDAKFGSVGQCTFGTSGSEYAWQFVAPDDNCYDSIKTAMVAKKVGISGGISNSIIKTPGAGVNRQLATQSIPHGVETYLTFENETWDSDTMATLATNNDRITIKTPGVYVINAHIVMTEHITGIRMMRIFGGAQWGGKTVSAPTTSDYATHWFECTVILKLAAAEIVQVSFYQTSGVALNVIISRLSVQRLSN